MQHLLDNNSSIYSTFTEGNNKRQSTFSEGDDKRQSTFSEGDDKRQSTFSEGDDKRQSTFIVDYIKEKDIKEKDIKEKDIKDKDIKDKDIVKKLVNKHEKRINNENHKDKANLICEICKDHSKKNYIILSCNHIFHICCLTQSHYKTYIEDDFFENCKCTICNQKLELEQIMYLHSTFMTNTKNLLANHQYSIENLEGQLQVLKIELRTLYDYRHKLEKEREKSKRIMCILNTML
jgi:hypothetical protein